MNFNLEETVVKMVTLILKEEQIGQNSDGYIVIFKDSTYFDTTELTIRRCSKPARLINSVNVDYKIDFNNRNLINDLLYVASKVLRKRFILDNSAEVACSTIRFAIEANKTVVFQIALSWDYNNSTSKVIEISSMNDSEEIRDNEDVYSIQTNLVELSDEELIGIVEKHINSFSL